MKLQSHAKLLLILFIGTIAILGSIVSAYAQQGQTDTWNEVWQALQAPLTLPLTLAQDGPPVREGERVLFRFRAPADAAKVYLAGSFNGFAANNNGTVTDDHYAMMPSGNGLYFKRIPVEAKVQQYKYVVFDKNGKFNWIADPHVKDVDKDGNSVLDFATLSNIAGDAAMNATPQRALKPFQPLIAALPAAIAKLDVRAQNVWVRPGEANTLLVTLGNEATPDARLSVRILTPVGVEVYQTSVAAKPGPNRIPIPTMQREGGLLARATLMWAGQTLAAGETVLSVVQNIADDLRYGFYASYLDASGDYDAKAAMLAALHINAVEFYDYFPAHGYYAPREASYKSEPFGVSLNARNVQQKIEAGHRRNILSLAYVASYAASESVYRQHPDPMTDEHGVPKIFNGSIMTETDADRQHKPKWFWLMDVAPGSPWHQYILDEFARTLDDSPNDLVSFDGFELDTYGDVADAKFYAKGSPRNGDLLVNVLHDFVGDVQKETHRIKPHGLVSFNSVNEFGAGKMGDVTDFAFLEIWDFYAPNLADIVNICVRNRAARQQRVMLKLYPATMRPGQKVWPTATLRRLLGATMTGAGSLMVVGEPDEKSGQMHALNTLYYPDHQPVSPANEQLLRDYYRFDALLYGWTHGRDVINTPLENAIPGCITRTYVVPSKQSLVVQMLNIGNATQWTLDTSAEAPRQNLEVTLDLPGGLAPHSVLFASPDVPTFQTPVKLDFEAQGGQLRTIVPELYSYGTLILRY